MLMASMNAIHVRHRALLLACFNFVNDKSVSYGVFI